LIVILGEMMGRAFLGGTVIGCHFFHSLDSLQEDIFSIGENHHGEFVLDGDSIGIEFYDMQMGVPASISIRSLISLRPTWLTR
jgi:hypothetical protein